MAEKARDNERTENESRKNDVLAGDDEPRKGVGRDSAAPEDGGHPTSEHDFGRSDRYANANEGDDYSRRDIPGGSHPAKTPGASGPSTRDTDRGAATDANEELLGRARIASELKARPRRFDD
jgi:hypothetical protein